MTAPSKTGIILRAIVSAMASLQRRVPRTLRWRCALIVGLALAAPTGLRAEESEPALRPGFFVNAEQSGAWTGLGIDPTWTTPRLGYRQPGDTLDWSVQLGPRFVGAERTDWTAKLEMAWRPAGALELYGEWEPAISTARGDSGLYQEAKAGVVINLGSGPVNFDDVQDFASVARGLYLKVEQQGAWGVGGRQELVSASPRLGWAFEKAPVSLAVEAGPGFLFSGSGDQRTDLLGKVDLGISLSDRWELYLEYEPSVGFVAEERGWVHRLKGGVVFAF
jgi:hypothetical protein